MRPGLPEAGVLGRRVRPDQQEGQRGRRVKARLGLRVLLAPRGRVQLEVRGRLAALALQAPRGLKARPEARDLLEAQVPPGHKGLLEPRGQGDQREQ